MIERLKMEKRAIAFREKYGLTEADPITHDLIERLGVQTIFQEMSKGISGMAIKVDDETRLMAINYMMPLGKQNFTIAHELYHLYEQENFTFRICDTELFNKKDKEELNADLFASHLLLPNDGVLKMIPEEELRKDRIQLPTILKIEQNYQCSRVALTIRLMELGIVSNEYRQQFLHEIAKNAIANGYTRQLYFETKFKFIGKDYVDSIKTLYDKGVMMESDYLAQLQDVGITEI